MKILLGFITALYPLVLYAGFQAGYRIAAVAIVVACFALRGYGAMRHYVANQPALSVAAGGAVAALGIGCASLHSKAPLLWPAIINASLCLVFLWSLRTPQNVIERIATRMEGTVPPEARRYCARVCVVWIVFFALNSAIAFDSAFRSLEWWGLYNGIISYCLIGALLLGEYAVRRNVKKRFALAHKVACVITLWCGMAAGVLAESAAHASPVTLESVQARLTPPGPFLADFTEKRFISVLAQPLEAQGSMRCIPHSGLLWEVRVPIARTSIITPRAVVDVLGQQTVSSTVDATKISQTMLSLMSGSLDAIDQHFDMTLSGTESLWEVQLTPRDSLVRDVVSTITVSGRIRPEQLEVRHASGDRVLTTFAEPRLLTTAELANTQEALKRAS